MIGQLPPEFFSEFYRILAFEDEDAVAFQKKLDELCQRRFLQEQLAVLPEVERNTFSTILEQDGVSASTINEFLEARIEDDVRMQLWEQSLLYLWGEVLKVVGEKATEKQKKEIKLLVNKYLHVDTE